MSINEIGYVFTMSFLALYLIGLFFIIRKM